MFEDRKITIEVEELRFEMMRHWNLYDVLHSPYVVTRLQTWKGRCTCWIRCWRRAGYLYDEAKIFAHGSQRGKANAGKIERARRVIQRVARFDVLVVYVPTQLKLKCLCGRGVRRDYFETWSMETWTTTTAREWTTKTETSKYGY